MEAVVNSTVFQYAIGLFALGFVVFIHELGHFLVARWCGIRVLRFSVGFGPRIFSFQRGETEYSICWLFFGGYVKFAGDDIDEDDARTIQGGYFASKPWKRNVTAAAGPVMNLIFAFLLYCVIFVIGKPMLVDKTPTTIGKVTVSSPASEAGLLPGDKIMMIDRQPVLTWRDVIHELILSGKEEIELQILRGQESIHYIKVHPAMDVEMGVRRIGVMKMAEIIIDKIAPGSPAESAGLMKGDKILSYAGKEVYSIYDLHEAIQSSAGEERKIEVEREGQRLTLTISAEYSEELYVYDIGITQKFDIVIVYPNPMNVFKQEIVNVFRTLRALMTGTVSIKGLGGPLRILEIIGMSAKYGFVFLLGILAMISVNLGILNLLPIPVLDGGHLLINTVESIRKKAIHRKTLAIIQYVFLKLLNNNKIY